MLYDILRHNAPPDEPLRTREQVLAIVNRWSEVSAYGHETGEWNWEELEQDIHALAHIAMQHLPD